MEENKFTEKDYLEAIYKIQRSIQVNITTIAFVVIVQLLITIAVLAFLYFKLSPFFSALHKIL